MTAFLPDDVNMDMSMSEDSSQDSLEEIQGECKDDEECREEVVIHLSSRLRLRI
jgi:hypothetical protein